MKIKKILLPILLSSAVMFAASATAQTFNLAYTLNVDSHYGKGAQVFADEIKKLSAGKFKINPKPSGALGGERDVVEGLQLGSVDLTITSTGPVGNFVPSIYALDFPFLFRDYQHAHRVLDGEIGQALLAEFKDSGLIGLAWSENGFRHLTNSVRDIKAPADLAGLKIRTMENKVHMSAFSDLGAAPTPMSFTELYTALQQGTVDGQENPIPVITSSKLDEVQKKLTLTGHVYSPAIVMMSKHVWDGLKPQEQQWFKQAAKVSAAATRQAVADIESNGVKFLREQGVEVIEQVDKAAFASKVQATYDKYGEKYGAALIAKIKAS